MITRSSRTPAETNDEQVCAVAGTVAASGLQRSRFSVSRISTLPVLGSVETEVCEASSPSALAEPGNSVAAASGM